MPNSLDELQHGWEHKIFSAYGVNLETAIVSDSKEKGELEDESSVWNGYMLLFWELPWT